MYEYRRGSEKDFQMTFQLYKTASDMGILPVWDCLGHMYESGCGTHKNLHTVFLYYSKAASVFRMSNFDLARMYEYG